MPPTATVSTLQPPVLTFSKNPTSYFGELKIDNKNGFLNAGNLQFTTNSVINGYAININKQGDTSALTINSQGVITTNGSINTSSSLNSSSLNTNGINIYANGSLNGTPTLTISDTGDLSINSKFIVNASSGNITTSGQITSKDIIVNGQITSTGSIIVASDKVILSNDGSINAKGTLQVGIDGESLKVTGTSVSMSKNLIVGSTALFNVNSATGTLTTSGILKSQGLDVNVDKFTVNSSGEAIMEKVTSKSASFASGNSLINADGSASFVSGSFALGKTIINSDGSASFANNNAKIGTDGHFETNFSNYSIPTDLRNSKSTTGNLSTTPSTSKYLTTQNYVDDGLWYIQKQINLITNDDSNVVDNFNNVFALVKKITGDSAIQSLDGIIDTTTEIKVSISDVIANSVNTSVVDCKSAVWADCCAPLPIPNSISSTYLFDGWFFQNMVNTPSTDVSVTNKINWYIPPNGSNMTIADIQNIYMNIFAISNKALPFISVYTQPKGTNGNSNENVINYFAHARINYYFEPSESSRSLTANTSYCLYTGSEPVINNYNVTNLQSTSTSTANGLNKNNGTYGTLNTGNLYDTTIVQPTDKVLCFTISTGSLYTKNDVKFILSAFNIKQKTGTSKFLFNNAAVSTNLLYNMNMRLNSDMTNIGSTQYGESVMVDGVNTGGTYLEKYKETYMLL